MKFVFPVLLLLSGPAFAQTCIPDPDTLTYGQKASDDWVRVCEKQFRNPLPNCHRLYAKPSDRALCLRAIEKIDAYYKQKPTHKTREQIEAEAKSVPLPPIKKGNPKK